MPQSINDAKTLNFLQAQARDLNNRAFGPQYQLVDYASIVPVNTEYTEWASGTTFNHTQLAGAAKWQSGWAKDVPKADVSLLTLDVAFAMYAVGYGYNTEELGKAMRASYPLTVHKASAARQAADLFVLETALTGGGHNGWTGLLNKAGVTPIVAPATGTGNTPNWVAADGTGLKTADQIVSEINALITGPVNTATLFTAILNDTILLPELAYNYLANTPYGPAMPGKTILQYVKENNQYTAETGNELTIRKLPYLAGLATGSVAGQGRAVGYRNDLSSLELPMPIVYRFAPVWQSGPFQFDVPGYGRIGQLTVIRDGAVRYLDGITPAV